MEPTSQDREEDEKEVKTGAAPPSASEDECSEALGNAVPQTKEKRKGKAEEEVLEGASTSNTHNKVGWILNCIVHIPGSLDNGSLV